MKKVLFTIGMIAILVGVAFAGMAASGKSNGVPADLNTLSAQITALQGNVSVLSQQVTNLQNTVNDMGNISGMMTYIMSELANVAHMESFEGNVSVSSGDEMPLLFFYPNARHVSITVAYEGMDAAGDQIEIVNQTPPVPNFLIDLVRWDPPPAPTVPADGWGTYQFDTDSWLLGVRDGGGQPLRLSYRVTVTYP